MGWLAVNESTGWTGRKMHSTLLHWHTTLLLYALYRLTCSFQANAFALASGDSARQWRLANGEAARSRLAQLAASA
jgi:hypothetical protein